MPNMFFDINVAIKALCVTFLKGFNIRSQKGAAIIEYAFLSILIAVVVVGAVQLVGEKTAGLYNSILGVLP